MIRLPRPVLAATSRQRIGVIFAASLLAGCSLFGSDSTRKPAKLGEIDAKLSVRQVWSVAVGKSGAAPFGPAPAGVSGDVVAAAADGQLLRVHAADGRVVWEIRVPDTLTGGPGSDGEVTVVPTTKGKLLAFDAAGKPIWDQQIPGEVVTPPVVTGGLVVARTIDSRIYAFDAASGRQRWIFQRPQAPLSLRTPFGMLVSDGAAITGFPGGKIGVLNLATGSMIWEATLSLARGVSEIERLIDVAGMPAVVNKRVCAAAFQGRIGCIELATGNAVWSREFSSATGVVADPQAVYAIDEKSGVAAFAFNNGAPLWRDDKLIWRRLGAPMLLGKAIVAGDFEGYVHFVSVDNGALVGRASTDGSPISAAPLLVADTLVVQTRGGKLFGFVPVR